MEPNIARNWSDCLCTYAAAADCRAVAGHLALVRELHPPDHVLGTRRRGQLGVAEGHGDRGAIRPAGVREGERRGRGWGRRAISHKQRVKKGCKSQRAVHHRQRQGACELTAEGARGPVNTGCLSKNPPRNHKQNVRLCVNFTPSHIVSRAGWLASAEHGSTLQVQSSILLSPFCHPKISPKRTENTGKHRELPGIAL